jgi:hypothetical protein
LVWTDTVAKHGIVAVEAQNSEAWWIFVVSQPSVQLIAAATDFFSMRSTPSIDVVESEEFDTTLLTTYANRAAIRLECSIS